MIGQCAGDGYTGHCYTLSVRHLRRRVWRRGAVSAGSMSMMMRFSRPWYNTTCPDILSAYASNALSNTSIVPFPLPSSGILANILRPSLESRSNN